ncbi:MAG: FAD-dependent oxidoreductase, partial [Oscillospiraceae bacterium]
PWDLCLAMAQTAVVNGAQLALNSEVTEIKKTKNGFLVRAGGKEYETKIIFNAAGIYGDRVHNLVAKPSFTICPRSGQYYLLDKSQGEKARHIIFQCPVGGTKGVLVAPTVHGNLIVGPDSTPVEGQGTDTTLEGLEFVRERGAKTIPSINFKENIRNFAGLRAAADREDFIIEGAEGAQGFFDLVGIKSPGLSAAAAIGERAVELARGAGLELVQRQSFCDTRRVVHFNKLSKKEKQELIATDPSYGRVICRCETITEGEILACLKAPIPPVSIDGVKRRVGAGMGRCQGGFCSPKVLEILAQHRGVAPEEICLDTQGSFILTGRTKGGKE